MKLEVERKDREPGDGTLHSLVVKTLCYCQLENYGQRLNERAREKSDITFRDWLKEKVRFRVEATEMVNGFKPKTFEQVRLPRAPKYPKISTL